MSLVYNIAIYFYGRAIALAAVLKPKAKDWIRGRENWQTNLSKLPLKQGKRIWLHAASLGEMEQGVPVLRKLKETLPDHQFIISFFSPSGYHNFKERDLADTILYMPLDTPQNAADFVSLLQPDLALFIKYEIWPNHLKALSKSGVKTMLAPAVFRDSQIYFKPYGGFFRKALKQFDAILVQDQMSHDLLDKIGVKSSVCGDSRFDQALQVKSLAYAIEELPNWINQQLCLIAGSSWPKEEELLKDLLARQRTLKVIVAPHEVAADNIQRIEGLFKEFGVSRFSTKNWDPDHRVLIIDNIGQLKKLYRYADLAFIGGGFGVSVHSTVEPAVYEIPIAFGPKHQKFIETREMLELGLAHEIENLHDLEGFIDDYHLEAKRLRFKPKMKSYLKAKIGASEKISQAVLSFLNHD